MMSFLKSFLSNEKSADESALFKAQTARDILYVDTTGFEEEPDRFTGGGCCGGAAKAAAAADTGGCCGGAQASPESAAAPEPEPEDDIGRYGGGCCGGGCRA